MVLLASIVFSTSTSTEDYHQRPDDCAHTQVGQSSTWFEEGANGGQSRGNDSCDITAVFGLLRDTAVTYSYKKKSPRRIGFFRDTRKISFGDFI